MRPNVLQMRRGPDFWQIRADFTAGDWHETFIGARRPWEEVKDDLAYCFPSHTIEQTEETYDA